MRDATAGAVPQPNGGHQPITDEQARAAATTLLLSGSLNGQGTNPVPAGSAGPGQAGNDSVLQEVLQRLGNGQAQPAATPTAPMLPPGLHLSVLDGAIVVTNNGGSLGFQAGQFGYVPNLSQPPVLVPPNPGLHFVPPPTFNTGPTGPAAPGGVQDHGAVDCIVR
jgi:hypothetical protein